MDEDALLLDEPLGTVVLYTTQDASGNILLSQQDLTDEDDVSQPGLSILNLEPVMSTGEQRPSTSQLPPPPEPEEPQRVPQARCEVCDEPFTNVADLLAHLRGCRPHKQFTCPKCPETFNVELNQELHLAAHRTLHDDLTCPVCERGFSRLASFRCHVSTLHRVEDVARCPLCALEMPFSSELRRHLRMAHGEGGSSGDADFCCLHCGLLFRTLPELRTHKIHHRKIRSSLRVAGPKRRKWRGGGGGGGGGGGRECPTCGKAFPKKSELDRHLRVHSGEKPFACQVCGKRFSQKGSLDQHAVVHSQHKPFPCQLCGAEFTQRGNLRKHVLRLHPDNPRAGRRVSFQCPLCPCVFGAVQPLNVHVARRHPPGSRTLAQHYPDLSAYHVDSAFAGASVEEIVRETRREVEKSSAASGGRQLADISKKLLKKATQELLKRQVSRVRAAGDGLVGSGLPRVAFRVEAGGRKRWVCPACSKELSRGSDLVRHMRQHTGEKPYSCQICPSAFSLRSSLNRHLSAHMGVKDQCGVCQKQLANPSSLRRHLRLHHAPAARCQQCERSFRSQGRLAAHIAREHSLLSPQAQAPAEPLRGVEERAGWAEPLLEDPTDGTATSLAEQKASEHRPWLCPQCHARYKYERNLRYHQVHQHPPPDRPSKPYRCLQCSRQFLTAKYLSEHLRTHTSRRPYNCSECPKAFHRSSALRRHSVVHSSYAPFLCPYCPLRFKRGTLARAHIRKRHKDAASVAPLPEYPGEVWEPHYAAPITYTYPQHSQVPLFNDGGLDMLSPTHAISAYQEVGGPDWVGEVAADVGLGSAFPPAQHRQDVLQIDARPTSPSGKQRKCLECGKEFKKPSDFQRHIRIHTGEKPHHCHICQKSFRVKSTLTSHMKTHSSSSELHSCSLCGAGLQSRAALKHHLRLHSSERPHPCPLCHHAFPSSAQLRRHEGSCHGESVAPVAAAPSPPIGALRGPADIVLGAGNSAFEPFQQSRLLPPPPPQPQPIPAVGAGGSVALSVRADGAVVVDVGGGPPNASTAVIDVAQIEELARQGMLLSIPGGSDSGSCVTVDPWQLLETLRGPGVGEDACAVCETGAFANAEQARAHWESEDHETACLNSGLQLRIPCAPAAVSVEVQAVAGPGPSPSPRPTWPCPDCRKSFPNKRRLERHSVVHTGIKAFHCYYCTKSFGQKASLQTHLKRVHESGGASAFTCSLCTPPKSFAQKFNLERHLKKVHGQDRPQPAAASSMRHFLSL